MLASAGLSLLLSSWLQRHISAPILALGDVARHVSASKDYTLRATSGATDEIGQLFDVFNEMLATVESRDRDVERHRLQLQEELRGAGAVNVELAVARRRPTRATRRRASSWPT